MELLAVLCIIAILAALTLPSLSSALDAQKLNAAARNVKELLAAARKKAIASNRVIEFRFRTDVGSANYTTCEVISYDQFGANPTAAQKPQRLPPGLIFANDSRSTLLAASSPQTETLSTGGTATYIEFQFEPDGSTSLTSSTNWYITIVRSVANTANVASLRIDPLTGDVAVYRP